MEYSHILNHIEKTKHLRVLFGEPLVFRGHCFNMFLLQTMQDNSQVPSWDIMTQAAEEVGFNQVSNAKKLGLFNDKNSGLQFIRELISFMGFGLIDWESTDKDIFIASSKSNHNSYLWQAKYNQKRNSPADPFVTGWLTGAIEAMLNERQGTRIGAQVKCISMGDDRSIFEVFKRDTPLETVFQSVGVGQTDTDIDISDQELWGNIPSQNITDAVAQLPLYGDEQGLIDSFDVLLTLTPSNYYQRVIFEFEKHLAEVLPDAHDATETLFSEAGHMCAFHTFGGIMKSPEWDGVVKPHIQTVEDWIYGMVSVVNSFGWGRWSVNDLKSAERLEIKVQGSHESNAFLAMYGKRPEPTDYLSIGVAAGLMNLFYQGDITSKPELDESYYQKLFQQSNSFLGQQIQSRSNGDKESVFVVERGQFD